MNKLNYKPEAILINVPEAFFRHRGKGGTGEAFREEMFRRFYESMGTPANPDACFYHFISSVPQYKVQLVYVCFKGKIQFKATVVEFLKNQPVHIENYDHDEPRDWCVTTGPVVKAPSDFPMKGFRGFRYTPFIF